MEVEEDEEHGAVIHIGAGGHEVEDGLTTHIGIGEIEDPTKCEGFFPHKLFALLVAMGRIFAAQIVLWPKI